MKAEIKEISSWKRQIDVEVDTAEIPPFVDKVITNYRKKVQIDGFRKGKVPLHLIRKQFGSAIEADVAEDLVEVFFAKAVTENNLPIVAPGVIKESSSISLDQTAPFRFTAEVEVEPEITVRHYKGIKTEKEIHPVSDDEVNYVIDMLREQRAEFESIETGAEVGSFIEGDVQALDRTGFPIVGQKWSNRVFELGKPPLGDQIVPDLLGAKAGDEKRFSILPSESDGSPSDAESQHYLIHVNDVKKKNLPELNDEFAQKVGEFQTVTDLTERIRSNVQAQHEEESERGLRQRIADEILKKNDFEIPPSMIDRALVSLWESYQKNHPTVNEEEYKSQNRPAVVWNLKWDILWHKIAEAESIQISDETLEAEIDRAATASPKEEKKIRALFKEEARRNRLRDQLLEEETMKFLKEQGKIKEVTVKESKKKTSKIITP